MLRNSILIVDDNKDVLKALSALLTKEGYVVTCRESPDGVLDQFKSQDVDLAIVDLNYSRDTTSGKEGLDLISQIRSEDQYVPIVVMTAYGSINLAIEVIKSGANDFIEKPWDNNRLVNIINTQLSLSKSRQLEKSWLDENLRRVQSESAYIAESKAMKEIMAIAEKLAPTDANVLITGEHGTGKSQLARIIHGMSDRHAMPFVDVNVGALSDPLFESELFGHVKGAFTDAKQSRDGRFKLADGGTLFLDEIGNLSLELQAKLLRVIETGQFEPIGSSRTQASDIRLIVATNANLDSLVGQGVFREDLLFRLNTFEIELPPLRNRIEDITPLANYFLERYKAKYKKPNAQFDADALSHLSQHSWPGNIRELDHVLQRAILLSTGDVISMKDLTIKSASPTAGEDWLNMTFTEVEVRLIEHALESCDGNIKQAAERLGIGRNALYRRLEKYGIKAE